MSTYRRKGKRGRGEGRGGEVRFIMLEAARYKQIKWCEEGGAGTFSWTSTIRHSWLAQQSSGRAFA